MWIGSACSLFAPVLFLQAVCDKLPSQVPGWLDKRYSISPSGAGH
jgi:hypothetical protein